MDMMKAQILGKVSELEFAKKCLDKGHVVSVPINDHGGYDFIVENGFYIKRVQVRASESPRFDNNQKCGRYKVNCKSTKGFDFLAFYMRDIDVWYIIPKHVITSSTIMITPNKLNKKKSKYDHYRENWDILFT